MKKIRKHLRTYTYLMTFISLCQSCAVAYHKTPVSLEEAAQKKTKTRIVLTDGRAERFNYVHLQDQQYFGIRKTGNGDIRIAINESAVKEVQVKNKGATNAINIGTVGASLGILIGIIGSQNCCGTLSADWE